MFVCMLLIATAVHTVESLKNSTINPTVPSPSLTNMAATWAEMQKLLASDGAAGDWFGWSVSLDSDTALIGVQLDDNNGTANSGSAYVFTRTGITWTQQQKLLATDSASDDRFGASVSLDGNTALIGAYADDDNGVNSGSVYVFTRTGTTWTQQAKLTASDAAANDQFGFQVSLSENTALIGAHGDDSYKGSAYVFTRTGTTWTQQQKLLAADGAAGDKFGIPVSLDGDTALIGAYTADGYTGSAYVFTRTGTTWTQQAKLTASDGTSGDYFGVNVALDGDTALIGACNDDADRGSVYVFTRIGTTWTQLQKLLATDGTSGDYFGFSVSLDGDTALIGSWSDSAYVFTRTGTIWIQHQKLLASDSTSGDYFGYYVSLDGDTALIGANLDDDKGVDSGSAYVFTKVIKFNIKGGLGVNLKITNNGTADANAVPWEIHVEGGILGLINKMVTDTIDIPAGESITVGTGLFFGLGPIIITAKVADEEKTATGTQIIIFSMVKK